jgi:hypothetical protein
MLDVIPTDEDEAAARIDGGCIEDLQPWLAVAAPPMDGLWCAVTN